MRPDLTGRLLEGGRECRIIKGRDRRQYVEWKLPPDHRRRERDILGRAKAIKAGHEAVLQRCRDDEGHSVVEIMPSVSVFT